MPISFTCPFIVSCSFASTTWTDTLDTNLTIWTHRPKCTFHSRPIFITNLQGVIDFDAIVGLPVVNHNYETIDKTFSSFLVRSAINCPESEN